MAFLIKDVPFYDEWTHNYLLVHQTKQISLFKIYTLHD